MTASFIHVSPARHVASVIERCGARHLITVLSPGSAFERPSLIDPANHLNLAVHDIVQHEHGFVSPAANHVAEIIAFARRWPRETPLAINCYAGVSRSTASAYIIAAALDPRRDEQELAAQLRALSPTATPNARLIAIADRMLDRNGRMVAAIEAIGRGEDCYEGTPFALPVG